MENLLRAALMDRLKTDPSLEAINTIEEENPLSASPPWVGIAATNSADWGTKDRRGREVRVAIELESRVDEPAADAEMVAAIEQSIATMPRSQTGFEIASVRFLRARSECRPNNLRGVLLEHRFRILET